MKFGRNLPRNQVPEWASAYINYKGLKKLVKSASIAANRGENVDLAEFFFDLDRNLEHVDAFYNKKFAETNRRIRLLQDRYGSSPEVVANLDSEEAEELMGALLELRTNLRNLQWFGEINRRGFVKITKKLDKKVPNNSSTQHRYIATKVDTCPFAHDNTLTRSVVELNRWLLVLGDANQIDDAKSDRSSHSLGRAVNKANLHLSKSILDRLDAAARSNDVAALETILREGHVDLDEGTNANAQGLLVNLLQTSISTRSRDNIRFILDHVQSLDEPDSLNQRNCIHRLVIHIRRYSAASVALQEMTEAMAATQISYGSQFLTPATAVVPIPRSSVIVQESPLLQASDERVQLLTFLLDSLKPSQHKALSARDSYGRMPLHYAAQFGFVVVCEAVISRMQAWGQFNVENGIDAPEWQDNEGLTPLHLSVIGGHPLTTQTLLRAENWKGQAKSKKQSGALLSIATKHNRPDIVQILMDAGIDINWRDEAGETALHIAARFGHDKCAKVLLEGSTLQKADLNVAENTFSWTPLHIASVDGHLSVAKLLVEAGADVDKADSSGWTSREHAALRGHLDISKFLLEHTNSSASPSALPSSDDNSAVSVDVETPPLDGTSSPPLASSATVDTHLSLDGRRSNGAATRHEQQQQQPQPVRTYGHRYLKDETLLLVSLGSMDMRRKIEVVTLDDVPLAEAHNTLLDTALSVVVSASGATGEPTVIDLPVQDNISTDPVSFTTKDISNVRLLFDIVPTYSGNQKNKIGRAAAMMSTVRPGIGSKRINLQGDVTVPIISSNLDVIGSVTFNFLVVTPFAHPSMGVASDQTYWRKVSSAPMVIGHRGLGKNNASNRSLQLGENTVPSFIAATNLGANYVEFDVQLTKDHIPVIYHDFLVSETGIDAPVHTLTLEQFLHINNDQRNGARNGHHNHREGGRNTLRDTLSSNTSDLNPYDGPASVSRSNGTKTNGVHGENGSSNGSNGNHERVIRPPRRAMSMSVGNTVEERMELEDRMRHTRDFKEKGYKANSRGNFIQAPFATLEDLFRQVPQSAGFNIEMKYPMLHESEEHEMDTYAVELNSFCDTVLTKVYDLADGRDIIFSSFNPDICLCLSFKQPNYPIMFLTDAGDVPVCDIRASSLQEAIRFARRWNLLGIVSLADPLVNSPRLVRVVKQNGLVCVSYGSVNNDPELVERQVKEGIDAVIVDSVLAIRKGLTKEETKATETDGSAIEQLSPKLHIKRLHRKDSTPQWRSYNSDDSNSRQ